MCSVSPWWRSWSSVRRRRSTHQCRSGHQKAPLLWFERAEEPRPVAVDSETGAAATTGLGPRPAGDRARPARCAARVDCDRSALARAPAEGRERIVPGPTRSASSVSACQLARAEPGGLRRRCFARPLDAALDALGTRSGRELPRWLGRDDEASAPAPPVRARPAALARSRGAVSLSTATGRGSSARFKPEDELLVAGAALCVERRRRTLLHDRHQGETEHMQSEREWRNRPTARDAMSCARTSSVRGGRSHGLKNDTPPQHLPHRG